MSQEERAARYRDLFANDHEHPSDCAYCPICATIAVVRNTKPEVLDHLASAARELIAAVGLMLEEAEEIIGTTDAKKASASKAEGKVRRIDIV
jgi:hypothetical protein